MAMTLRQLRYFVEIGREGSFTAAAQRLSVAQPALSYQIAQLEAHLGTALFTRTAKGVLPTDAGAILLAHAQAILRGLAEAETAIRDLGTMVSGTVTVGLLSSTAPFLAPILVGEARRRFPQVTVALVEGDNRAIFERLRAGLLDLAVTLPGEDAGPEEPLVTEELFLYSRRGGPASGRPFVSLAEALEHPLVLPPSGQMMRDLVEAAAASRGLVPRVVVEAGYATGRSLVEAGIGCGIATFATFKTGFEAGIFDAAVLADPPIRRTLVLAEPRDGRGDRAAREIRRILLRAVEEVAPALRWHREPPPGAAPLASPALPAPEDLGAEGDGGDADPEAWQDGTPA